MGAAEISPLSSSAGDVWFRSSLPVRLSQSLSQSKGGPKRLAQHHGYECRNLRSSELDDRVARLEPFSGGPRTGNPYRSFHWGMAGLRTASIRGYALRRYQRLA